MPAEKIHRHRLPTILTPEASEALLRAAEAAGPESIEIEVSNTPVAAPLALGRLVGFLAVASWKRLAVRAHLPDTKGGEPSPTWTFLSETAFGFLLTQAVQTVTDNRGADIRPFLIASQQSSLRRHNGIIGTGDAYVLPAITGSSPATQYSTSSLMNEHEPHAFRVALATLLGNLFGHQYARIRALDWIAKYAFEINQNTIDHGTTDLAGRPVPGIRALMLQRHRLAFDTALGESIVFRYLEALNEAEIPAREFLELTIVDSGVGIPARLQGEMTIYERSRTEEVRRVTQALTPEGTSKRRVMGAGLGLPTAMKAVERTRGLVTFRTGHVSLFRHYLGKLEVKPTPEGQQDVQLFELHDQNPSLALGTALSLLIPVA